TTPPEETAGAGTIRATSAHVNDEAGEQRDDRERDEPADLTDELAVEEPEEAGRAAESGAATAVDAPAAPVDAEAAAEESEDARKSVVSEKEIERGVVRAPTDVRTERGGDRIHDDHPPAARNERRHAR